VARKRSRANAGGPGGAAPTGSSRSAAQPTRADLDQAREDALLQLRIGRSAHYYSVAFSVALLVDAFLVLYLAPSVTAIGRTPIRSLFPLVFPLIGGLYLSILALRLKWDAYQFTLGEPHFLATLGAVALNLLLSGIFVARLAGAGPAAHWDILPSFYPLALLGITAALASFALVWTGWTHQKIASILAAIIPPPLSLVLFIPAAHQSPAAAANALATTLFVSAALFQTSGSFLHLISSGTEPHRQGLIQGGQARLMALSQSLQQKEEALLFREQTLVGREADVESAQAGLAEQSHALEEVRSQLATLEQNLSARGQELAQQEETARIAVAQAESLRQSFEQRQADFQVRERELASQSQRVLEREKGLSDREVAVSRRDVEFSGREKDIAHRTEELKQLEARLNARQQQIEKKTIDLLQRESSIKSHEGVATVVGADRQGLARKHDELARRELELNQLKARVDEDNAVLQRKTAQLSATFQEAQRTRDEIAKREQQLAARETAVKQLETQTAEKAEAVRLRETHYQSALQKAEARLREIEGREGKLGTRAGEVERIGQQLGARETSLRDREAQLAQRREEFARRERDLLERERRIEARESEVSLKSIALQRRPDVFAATAPGLSDEQFEERLKTLEIREKQLREKEQQLLNRAYEAQKEPSVSDSTLSTAPTRRLPDRLPTGTPRLDDLLLGGFGPKSHVLLVGPPFSGKEMLLYSFVAEGLKRGEPTVLVTTSRTPEELAQELGKVTPQFREYEQLGLVSWIDASNPAATPSVQDGGSIRAVVKGPVDHSAILTALVKAAQKAENSKQKAFRVGFLGLSASLGQSEEREAFGFLQNFVGILKQRSALALYVVEQGTIPDGRVESIQGRMDGAIRFKQERGKSFLSVQGLGDVQTRDWVEYRATNRQLVIGSFALERIR
jgi:KaiC/GvpD/RAD55 family RecA-like ATPase